MEASDSILACDVVRRNTGLRVLDAAPVAGRGEVNQVHVVTAGDGARFVVRSHQRAELDRFRK